MQTQGGITLNSEQCSGLVSFLSRRGLWGEFAEIMGQAQGAQPRTTRASTRRNVRRSRTTRPATNGTAIQGNAERLMAWARESGKPFSLSEASRATGIPYNSAAKLVAGLVRKHNLGKSGRGVYQLGTAPAH